MNAPGRKHWVIKNQNSCLSLSCDALWLYECSRAKTLGDPKRKIHVFLSASLNLGTMNAPGRKHWVIKNQKSCLFSSCDALWFYECSQAKTLGDPKQKIHVFLSASLNLGTMNAPGRKHRVIKNQKSCLSLSCDALCLYECSWAKTLGEKNR